MGPAEKAVFYVLIFGSVAYMIWQVWQRAQLWRKGKPISWTPHYVGSVVKYILGQRKVQSSRPKSGAPMHMMIFYGFLALLVATTLLAIAEYGFVIGIPNFHEGGYYLLYEMTFDILGMVYLIGVTWAILRRWKEIHKPTGTDPETGEPLPRKTPLSHEPGDWYALALLFALGVSGFILEGARMAARPQPWDWSAPIGYAIGQAITAVFGGMAPVAYKVWWWCHTALVVTFFCVLPKMKIKHIITATLTASGKSEQPMGELMPISMEEVEETGKIGVAEATDYSRWHLMSLDACMSCGRCTEVCPAHNVGKVLNPKQVVADIHKALVTGDNVPATVSEEALWACTTCNACVEACPVLIRHVDMIVDARRNLVAEGRFSGTGAVMLRQVGSGHAWGGNPNSREDWMKGLDIPLARTGGDFEYLFWVGCAGAMDPGAVKTTKAVAQLLQKAGVSFACLGKEEACTGDPARRVGDEFLFQEKAMQNQTVFQKYGVKKVVTACPHCFNSLMNEYQQFGPKMEVWHHTQLLAELAEQGRLQTANPENGEVTYHDPCYLARVNGESDAPRRLVGAETEYNTDKSAILHALEKSPGVEHNPLAEPQKRAHKTLCCGAGGGRMWMEEEPDQRPGVRRSNELLATGAKTIAVSCPFCRIMLDASVKQVTKEEINLVDLAEMMLEANKQ